MVTALLRMLRRAMPSIVWACGSPSNSMRRTAGTRPKQSPELISEVYEDEGYMVPYMWAAILIYPFWPSMISHIALYRDDFLKALPPGAKVLELASGHGVMGLLAAETRSDIQVEGFDISPPAVAVANRLLGVSGHGHRVTFEVKDALKLNLTEKPRNISRELLPPCWRNICKIRAPCSK